MLPLQNLSGDPSQEYFSDGMTEELITELSRIGGMKVISRTSVMRYKNTDKSLPEIARQLGVDGIVEGSVLRSGGRVRITAQLIYARTDANVWAETYDRDSQDVFGLQEAVASAVANKVKATMIPSGIGQSSAAHRVNFKAHEAYLRGFHEHDIPGTPSNRQGLQEEADEHDRERRILQGGDQRRSCVWPPDSDWAADASPEENEQLQRKQWRSTKPWARLISTWARSCWFVTGLAGRGKRDTRRSKPTPTTPPPITPTPIFSMPRQVGRRHEGVERAQELDPGTITLPRT